MFQFANSNYITYIAFLPILLLLAYLNYKLKKKKLLKFTSNNLLQNIVPSMGRINYWLKNLIILFSLLFLLIALARPRFGSKLEKVKKKGAQIFVAMDVSLSMASQDLKPSRLENAKIKMAELLNTVSGDKLGIIVFAGASYIQCPMTDDYSALQLLSEGIEVNSVPAKGTNISSAIELALKSYDYNSPSDKILILITDGEDHEGGINDVLDEAKSKNVKIFTIGIGSAEGSAIQYRTLLGDVETKYDKDNQPVVSKLNESLLRNIASTTNGKYYNASYSVKELDDIYGKISYNNKTNSEVYEFTAYDEKFFYFAILGLILLVWELFISEKRSTIIDKILRTNRQ